MIGVEKSEFERIVKKISVSKDLANYIVPLSDEELFLLESSLVENGCREPLVVWEKSPDNWLLVDGHNRYRLCLKNRIQFRVHKMTFESVDRAKIWMIDNQMGRRNLTADQLSYYRGLKYLSLKKVKGGYNSVISKGQASLPSSELVGRMFNVSESTIKRDAKFAEGLDIIGSSNPGLKGKILTGIVSVRKGDVQVLADAKHPKKVKIKNEADLYNKAKLIRNEVLEDIEQKVTTIENERMKEARQVLLEREPVFLDRSDRLRKIKGMIISAINRAIEKKDGRAIAELRELIDRLAHEL